MLKYWISETDGYSVYSCDMLRLSFKLSKTGETKFLRFMSDINRSDIEEFNQNLTAFKYRFLWKINYFNSSSLVVGYHLNANKDKQNIGFLEFNPNKVFQDPTAISDFNTIKSFCKINAVSGRSMEVVRWDLAIDIPEPRECCHLVKDSRAYSFSTIEYKNEELKFDYKELVQKSYADRTEYLGPRSAPGRVKLYNKMMEAKLLNPLTRLEVTLGPLEDSQETILGYIPSVEVDRDLSQTDSLNATQQIIVEMYRASDQREYLDAILKSKMCWSTYKKIKPFIHIEESRLKVDTQLIYKIISHIKTLVN